MLRAMRSACSWKCQLTIRSTSSSLISSQVRSKSLRCCEEIGGRRWLGFRLSAMPRVYHSSEDRLEALPFVRVRCSTASGPRKILAPPGPPKSSGTEKMKNESNGSGRVYTVEEAGKAT